MHDEHYVLKIYSNIFLIASVIIGFLTIINYKTYGEAIELQLMLDRIDLFLILIIHCIPMLLAFSLWEKTKNWHFFSKHYNVYLYLDNRKIHLFVFFVLISQLLFSLYSGNGRVGHENIFRNTYISYIFNILKIDAFMPLYYVVSRNKSKKLYWINIILWLIYQLVCGWSIIIFEIFILEFYMRVREKSLVKIVRYFYKSTRLCTLIAIMLGAFLYRFVWSLKFTIRSGYSIPILGYCDALEKLILRFTSYPMSVAAVQNHQEIISLYLSQGVSLVDIKAIFRPLLPTMLMPDKGFRNLNNIVLQPIYPSLANSTSTDYGLLFFMKNLFNASIFDFIVYILVGFLLFIISKKIIYAFDDGSKKVDILYFLLIFSFLKGNSAEELYGYGYLSLIYMIPIMFFLKIIKLKLFVRK